VLGKWAFESKLYRENVAALPKDSSTVNVSFLHTLQLSQHAGKMFCLKNGKGTVLEGDFDAMMTTKLQSVWTLRQVIKGEGRVYDLKEEDFIIRTANIFLQGAFKGFLLEVEYKKDPVLMTDEELLARFNGLLKRFNLEYKGEVAKNAIETALLFVEVLSR
jgi:TATA-binding related factor (TRF) of subunit 20 of Mediator complex